jgi:hypothetical protein
MGNAGAELIANVFARRGREDRRVGSNVMLVQQKRPEPTNRLSADALTIHYGFS